MKKHFLMGMAFVLAFGLAFSQEGMADTGYPVDKIIRDDDLLHYNLDPNRATVNQMPAESDAEGSAAGGIRDDFESMRNDDQNNESVEKDPTVTVPDNEGAGAGGVRDDSESMRSDDDQSNEPIERDPTVTAPDNEGAGAGGPSKDLERY